MKTEEDRIYEYLNIKSINKLKVIPNRFKYTFLSSMEGYPQPWVFENNRIKKFVNTEDRVMDLYHSPCGTMSVVGMDDKGNEKQQLYLFKHESATLEPLILDNQSFHHFGAWSDDGKFITFSSNKRNHKFFDVYRLEIESKNVEMVYKYDGKCLPLCWLPGGDHILIEKVETNIDQSIYLLNLKTRNEIEIGGKARYHNVELTRDGKAGYILTDLGEQTMYVGYFTFNESIQIYKFIHHPNWEVEDMKLSPDGCHIAYVVNEDGISRLHSYHINKNEDSTIREIPDGVIGSISWVNHNHFVFSMNTPKVPGDIWEVAISDKEVKRLTYLSSNKEIASSLEEPKLYKYDSFDGREIPYFYYKSSMQVSHPAAVIYVHGGPESQIRATYNPMIQYLVNQGITVIAPNIRGSKGYGRDYIHLDDGRKRMDAVKDLVWLAESIVNTHGINPQRIGIMGKSYGGYMVLSALSHYPEIWAAGVDVVGLSNIKSFLEHTAGWRRHFREYEYGSLKEDADYFDEIAPVNHSHRIKAPLLVFHGRNDTRVPITESENIVSRMRVHGQSVEFTIFEDEGHQTEKIHNQIVMNRQIAEFFKKNL